MSGSLVELPAIDLQGDRTRAVHPTAADAVLSAALPDDLVGAIDRYTASTVCRCRPCGTPLCWSCCTGTPDARSSRSDGTAGAAGRRAATSVSPTSWPGVGPPRPSRPSRSGSAWPPDRRPDRGLRPHRGPRHRADRAADGRSTSP